MRNAIFLALMAGCLSVFTFPSQATQIYQSHNAVFDPNSQPQRQMLNFRDPTNLTLSEAIDHVRMFTPIEVELEELGLDQAFDRRGADCDGFIRDDGSYGTYGRIISRAFTEHRHLGNLLSNDAASKRGMGRLCPNFNRLSRSNRVKFWVWTFASIAWAESTCLAKATARGTNTTAVGLLQMEKPLKSRSWRGQLCKKFADVSSPGPNLLCGMEIMHGHFAGKYEGSTCSGKNAQGLVLRCSYWQKLRQSDSTITRLISLMPECGGPARST